MALARAMPALTLQQLLSTAQCLTLYTDLWGCGVLGRHSEAAQEQFFALVAYAMRVGTDPPRLLAYLLRTQAFDRITPRDTAAAQARLHAYRVGQATIEDHRRQAAARAKAWQEELAQRVDEGQRQAEAAEP